MLVLNFILYIYIFNFIVFALQPSILIFTILYNLYCNNYCKGMGSHRVNTPALCFTSL